MKNLADDLVIRNDDAGLIELRQSRREKLDREHLPMNAKQLDILSNSIRFGKNDRQSGDDVCKYAMKSKSHAHASDANRCNQRRDLETKLVERHQKREHKDENSDCSDDQQAHRRLLHPSFEASIGEVPDPAGQENADYYNDN